MYQCRRLRERRRIKWLKKTVALKMIQKSKSAKKSFRESKNLNSSYIFFWMKKKIIISVFVGMKSTRKVTLLNGATLAAIVNWNDWIDTHTHTHPLKMKWIWKNENYSYWTSKLSTSKEFTAIISCVTQSWYGEPYECTNQTIIMIIIIVVVVVAIMKLGVNGRKFMCRQQCLVCWF